MKRNVWICSFSYFKSSSITELQTHFLWATSSGCQWKPSSCWVDSEEKHPSCYPPILVSWHRWRYLCTEKETKSMHPGSFLAVCLESTAFWTVLTTWHRWDFVCTVLYLCAGRFLLATLWQEESNSSLKFPFVFTKSLSIVDCESDDCFYASKTGNIFFFDTWWLIWGSGNNQVELDKELRYIIPISGKFSLDISSYLKMEYPVGWEPNFIVALLLECSVQSIY